MNPCPCGFLTDPKRECNCTPQQIQRYLRKISGPLLDRIDIHLAVPSLKYEELSCKGSGAESSSEIAKRVIAARRIQKKRYAKEGISCNAYLAAKRIERFCSLDSESTSLLKMAVLNMGLTARAYHKVVKVARTIAYLAQEEQIKAPHISEAIQYRSLDRMEMIHG